MNRITSLSTLWLLPAFLLANAALSQSSANAAGGNASGNGGSVSYSIGQPFTQTHSAAAGSVAEGVQQPYEISTVSGIAEASGILLSIAAYPNPTANNLTLEIKNFTLSGLSMLLFDMHGKLLKREKITDSRTIVELSDLEAAVYFLKVIDGQREVKTFKIVKTQ